jgi:hypothetical protein
MDGSMDKTNFNVYDDRTDEEFLKLMKEFQNCADTYKIGRKFDDAIQGQLKSRGIK